jgi:hypothetical protein
VISIKTPWLLPVNLKQVLTNMNVTPVLSTQEIMNRCRQDTNDWWHVIHLIETCVYAGIFNTARVSNKKNKIKIYEFSQVVPKKSPKTPKWQLESANWRRTDNTYNGQKKKDKQRSTKYTHKTKDRVTQILLKIGGELRCSGRVSSSCPP